MHTAPVPFSVKSPYSAMSRLLHPQAIPRKPQGQPTRGKTARNRLRRVDTFLLRYDPALLRAAESARAWMVDLGYGAEPFTTLEMAARLRRLNPTLPVLGVEIDPVRVAAALPYADACTDFRLGGFNLPVNGSAGERVRLVRAFNVLRQYDEAAVADAWWRVGQSVLPGGLMIEGTSDPLGRVWVANVLRRTADDAQPWRAEALVFSTNFRTGFDPAQFQPVLPKNLIHRMRPGEWIDDFFTRWKKAALTTSVLQTWGVRQWFVAAGETLRAQGAPVDAARWWLRHGYLVVMLGR